MPPMLSSAQDSASSRGRGGRTVFALLAIVSFVIGAGLFLYGSALGLEPEVAGLMALAFFFVAAFDVIVLVSWRRIFKTMP